MPRQSNQLAGRWYKCAATASADYYRPLLLDLQLVVGPSAEGIVRAGPSGLARANTGRLLNTTMLIHIEKEESRDVALVQLNQAIPTMAIATAGRVGGTGRSPEPDPITEEPSPIVGYVGVADPHHRNGHQISPD